MLLTHAQQDGRVYHRSHESFPHCHLSIFDAVFELFCCCLSHRIRSHNSAIFQHTGIVMRIIHIVGPALSLLTSRGTVIPLAATTTTKASGSTTTSPYTCPTNYLRCSWSHCQGTLISKLNSSGRCTHGSLNDCPCFAGSDTIGYCPSTQIKCSDRACRGQVTFEFGGTTLASCMAYPWEGCQCTQSSWTPGMCKGSEMCDSQECHGLAVAEMAYGKVGICRTALRRFCPCTPSVNTEGSNGTLV